MKDGIIGILFIGFWLWCGAMWVYGEAFLFKTSDYIGAVLGLVFPPIGCFVGAYQWLF